MIQEKYNRRIFDEGTEEAIQMFSHLRSNVLSPVGIEKGDNVLILDPDSASIIEWLQEQAADVTIGMSQDYSKDNDSVMSHLPALKKQLIDDINSTFSIIISIGKLVETPSVLKKHLAAEGRLVYALSEKDRLGSFAKKLLAEAGFKDITTYRVSPDYLYTTEIYAEDYIGGGAGDYLLIAR
ncbi:MAG: hypothetical protein K6D38_10915 [Pseudobutyrivibrio sp.]|nr:hypothetical protein [Pseudobutyrivibrio sp.]